MISDLEKLIELAKKYLEVRIEILKLDTKEQLSIYLIKVGLLMGGTLTLLLVLLFLSMGFAIYLNEVLSSNYLGYFILAGAFTVIFLTIVFLRNNKTLKNIFYRFIDFFIFD